MCVFATSKSEDSTVFPPKTQQINGDTWWWQLQCSQLLLWYEDYVEMFQNDSEETEGKERKGNRPGVLRCGYCVKQGNVVSAQPLITD